MKEKNLRCKFGKIEASNVGNVNQEGIQEDIIRRQRTCERRSSLADRLRYMAGVTYTITSGYSTTFTFRV